jgi:hypothetical protein
MVVEQRVLEEERERGKSEEQTKKILSIESHYPIFCEIKEFFFVL